MLRQALAFALLAGALVLMFEVTRANLAARGVHTGFDFLARPAVTPVHTWPLEFRPGASTFGDALLAGVLNTLKLTVACIAWATLAGLVVGLGSVSRNPLARRLAALYVEVMRNVPVLLHVVLWYGLLLELPPARSVQPDAWFAATNRGIFLLPQVDGLSVSGVLSMSPEFAALLVGIGTYTAAFVAEIVRAAIGAVPAGQWEACAVLGVGRGETLRRVVAPQAMRVALPPLSSEYMGIFKNSTLGVAVGYQDFMAVGETMLTDTGQAVEIMALVMLFYAAVSLVVSAAMHALERRHHHWSRR